ncbi:MAG: DNA-binding protein [Betaproteobacteria bacterium]|jgi:hypothetical protein|nr:DNA-binding protein [Betaproteobacteria bacterium]
MKPSGESGSTFNTHPSLETEEYCGTSFAAKQLKLSVGTIQSLVKKNELIAWETLGGHRRISIRSVFEYQKRVSRASSQHLSGLFRRLKVLVVEDDL